MPHAQTQQVNLYYETTGDPTAPPLVLIAGQGAQLISWPQDLRDMLTAAGFQVLALDNRDVGLSTKCENKGTYELSDMATDVAELIRTLGFQAAHIVGQSMGGMIAQLLAIEHPHRVLSLCSIYSAPSPAFITTSTQPEVWAIRNRPPAQNRDEAVQQYIERERLCGLDELSDDWILAYAQQTIDRCYYPPGGERQMAAVLRSTDRTVRLHQLDVPTAVIHGRDDHLIDYHGGITTATAIPNAELHLYPEMGHQLLPALWDEYARVIIRNAGRADKANHGGRPRTPHQRSAG